ncbi:peptidylprolyl isomerase [Gulosibacter sp. 10]|uniref:peptidylprolyl isomerase n=1 Tax=Gulosibacter sp. 10 TaxID=1255570 RepID=UPI00097EB299|nr:peptidylprolyl isomerase [Gulosibacter sp. 10]SJM54001.1 Peptidyl-prolyl cis-trans isomerase [Gulosibacter sp. 10]
MADSSKKAREERRRAREYEARIVVNDVQQDRRRRDNRTGIAVLAVVAVLAVAATVGFYAAGGQTTIADAPETPAPTEAPIEETAPAETGEAPSPELAENREWTGTMTLNGGLDLGITIDGANAPQAASNFIDLSQQGFYDQTPCHRLTTEGLFVLQCGDPTGTGTGGPGYSFGPLENVPEDDVYPAGTIAMARAQAEDSMGSQFFIVYEDTELPAPGYTVFGQVTDGLDQLKAEIVDQGVTPGMSETDGQPVVPVDITGITLE